MDATYSAAVRMKAGDLLEVRVMADQASSNEDVGIADLQVQTSHAARTVDFRWIADCDTACAFFLCLHPPLGGNAGGESVSVLWRRYRWLGRVQ